MLFLLLLHLLVAVISMYLCDDIFLFHFVKCCTCIWLIGYHVYQDNWKPDIGDLYNIIYCIVKEPDILASSLKTDCSVHTLM